MREGDAMTEHQLQASIIAECNLRANQDSRRGRVFAVPNGGHRNKATAGKLNANCVHVYHACRDERCDKCHGQRFRRRVR